MPRLLALIILMCICSTIFGQLDSTKTEIVIIGTIHKGNKYFSHKTLYKLLEKLNPDIILNEDTHKFKPVFGLKTATFLKIVKPHIEQLALQTFLKRNRNTILLPYDTTFATQRKLKKQRKIEFLARKKYIKNSPAIKQSFHDNLYNATKTFSDSTIYADFANKHNFYYSFLDTLTLRRINQKDIIDKSRELYYLEEKVILPLGKKYISDSLIVNKFSNEIQFWIARNEYMANQILKYSKQFQGKRIVILTGLNHKYFLLDKLSEPKGQNLEIIEFMD